MATSERIKRAASELEAAMAKADAAAGALHQACDEKYHTEDNPPAWVYFFSSTVHDLNAAGLRLVEAINAAR